jgi:hypothetical protein
MLLGYSRDYSPTMLKVIVAEQPEDTPPDADIVLI